MAFDFFGSHLAVGDRLTGAAQAITTEFRDFRGTEVNSQTFFEVGFVDGATAMEEFHGATDSLQVALFPGAGGTAGDVAIGDGVAGTFLPAFIPDPLDDLGIINAIINFAGEELGPGVRHIDPPVITDSAEAFDALVNTVQDRRGRISIITDAHAIWGSEGLFVGG